jgi:bifunctional DNA-binding transcriptional regulator/antitoxin component of YhaV-PrlF toxin-antitoxin module
MNAPSKVPAPASVTVSATGRLSLPLALRRMVGLERGGRVVVEVKNGTIRLRTIDEVMAQARKRTRELLGDDASVDDFLKFRRESWRE